MSGLIVAARDLPGPHVVRWRETLALSSYATFTAYNLRTKAAACPYLATSDVAKAGSTSRAHRLVIRRVSGGKLAVADSSSPGTLYNSVDGSSGILIYEWPEAYSVNQVWLQVTTSDVVVEAELFFSLGS